MSFFEQLLREDGPVSTVRVMSFISLLSGVSIAAYGLYMNRDITGLSVLCGVFVGSAFGAKVTQKLIESKKDDA